MNVVEPDWIPTIPLSYIVASCPTRGRLCECVTRCRLHRFQPHERPQVLLHRFPANICRHIPTISSQLRTIYRHTDNLTMTLATNSILASILFPSNLPPHSGACSPLGTGTPSPSLTHAALLPQATPLRTSSVRSGSVCSRTSHLVRSRSTSAHIVYNQCARTLTAITAVIVVEPPTKLGSSDDELVTALYRVVRCRRTGVGRTDVLASRLHHYIITLTLFPSTMSLTSLPANY